MSDDTSQSLRLATLTGPTLFQEEVIAKGKSEVDAKAESFYAAYARNSLARPSHIRDDKPIGIKNKSFKGKKTYKSSQKKEKFAKPKQTKSRSKNNSQDAKDKKGKAKGHNKRR